MPAAQARRPWASSYAPGVPLDIDVPEESLVDLLEVSIARFPDHVALDFFGADTTYTRLGDQVLRAAEGLRRLGVQAGDRVALVLPNCPQHVVAFYAVLRLGAIVVEHNPLYTAEEMSFQLGDHRPRVIVVWDKVAPLVQRLASDAGAEHVLAVDLTSALTMVKRFALHLPLPKAREARAAMTARASGVPSWDRMVSTSPLLDPAHPGPAPRDVALLQYTGGTTGLPKAAVLTHRNLRANAAQGRAWIPGLVDGDEVIYAVLPLFHAYGLTLCLTFAVSIGATLVLLPRFDVDMVLDAVRRRPPTFLPAVPPIYERLATTAKERGVDLSSVRYAISGAMSLPKATAELWESVTGGILMEGYGMTETSPVALGNPALASTHVGSIGVPFPSTEVQVVDQEDYTHVVPHGHPGELLLRGPQVFSGYWERPEESAHVVLEGGWIRTGDVVVMDDAGFFTIVDRIKELIITGGFNVYPSEVENVLRQTPGIDDAVVVGLPSPNGGEDVVAAVVLEPGSDFDEAAVREVARQRLTAYKVPKRVFVVDELPRSMIGKVLRREVRGQLLEQTRQEGGSLVELRDGSQVLIRQVHREDMPMLEEGISRLSAESRQFRFLSDKRRLSPTELRYFTHIDHHNHEALGARDTVDGRGLGIARFIRDPDNPEVAELAIAVVDDWHRRGLGSELLSQLFVRAREEGICRFTALVADNNEAMTALLPRLGGEIRVVAHDAGAMSYEITPAPEGRGTELHDLMRAIGRGELTVPGAIRDAMVRLVPARFHD